MSEISMDEAEIPMARRQKDKPGNTAENPVIDPRTEMTAETDMP